MLELSVANIVLVLAIPRIAIYLRTTRAEVPVVRDFADRVIVMKAGKIVEEGPAGRIFNAPREAYTRALLAASLDPDPIVQAARRAAHHSEGLVSA